MARDPGLAELSGRKIGDGTSAPRAVYEAFGVFRDTLAGAGDYLAARVADLDDIRDRAVAVLLGVPVPGVPDADEPFVLVARDLAPADTALLDPAKVVAFVTEEGGPTSHTAILARAMGVPAVVACPGAPPSPKARWSWSTAATGECSSTRRTTISREHAWPRRRVRRPSRRAGPGTTSDGHAVPLLANIGGTRDVAAALEHGAEGVGLFRTEFLFLDRATPPSEDEQEAAYRAVLEAFPYVVVRYAGRGCGQASGLPARDGRRSPIRRWANAASACCAAIRRCSRVSFAPSRARRARCRCNCWSWRRWWPTPPRRARVRRGMPCGRDRRTRAS